MIAFAMLGDGDKAAELFSIVNPINRSSTPADAHRYKVEPYVVCADVYGARPHIGRGGWTWYSGSAGWLYRLIVESLLGLRLESGKLRLHPGLPRAWESFKMHYRYRETFYAKLLETVPGDHGARLRVEAGVTRQPFGAARRHLNQALARWVTDFLKKPASVPAGGWPAAGKRRS